MNKTTLILLFLFLFGSIFSNNHTFDNEDVNNVLKAESDLLVEYQNGYTKNEYLAQNEPKKPKSEPDKEPDEESDEDPISSFLGSNTVLYFFMGVLIPLGLFVILAISVKKKLPKKDD